MHVQSRWRIWFGLVAGIGFGLLDMLPMLMVNLPDRALAGAFASRFAIGFLIPQVSLPIPGWTRGLLVALLISTPDAIITRSYQTIFLTGAVGGVLIGALTGWLEERKRQVLEPA